MGLAFFGSSRAAVDDGLHCSWSRPDWTLRLVPSSRLYGEPFTGAAGPNLVEASRRLMGCFVSSPAVADDSLNLVYVVCRLIAVLAFLFVGSWNTYTYLPP